MKKRVGFLSFILQRYDAQTWKVGFQISVISHQRTPGGTGKPVEMTKQIMINDTSLSLVR